MTKGLPIQRVEVSFVGVPPVHQIERASGVSEVEIDGPMLRCLVSGSFQPFLEALRGHEVISLESTVTDRKPIQSNSIGETEMQERLVDGSQRSYARLAGLMYLVVLILDIAGSVIVSSVGGTGTFVEVSHRILASETLYRVGLGLALAGSLTTIVLAVSLYATLKPVDGNLTMMALLFRLAESAIGAMGIVIAFSILQIQLAANHANAFDANQLGALANLSPATGTQVSAIFFSAGSTVFFCVFLKSGYIPRILSAWGIFASLAYLAVWLIDLIVPNHPGLVIILGSLPILVAEVGTATWLLTKGIRNSQSLSGPVTLNPTPLHSSAV